MATSECVIRTPRKTMKPKMTGYTDSSRSSQLLFNSAPKRIPSDNLETLEKEVRRLERENMNLTCILEAKEGKLKQYELVVSEFTDELK